MVKKRKTWPEYKYYYTTFVFYPIQNHTEIILIQQNYSTDLHRFIAEFTINLS